MMLGLGSDPNTTDALVNTAKQTGWQVGKYVAQQIVNWLGNLRNTVTNYSQGQQSVLNSYYDQWTAALDNARSQAASESSRYGIGIEYAGAQLVRQDIAPDGGSLNQYIIKIQAGIQDAIASQAFHPAAIIPVRGSEADMSSAANAQAIATYITQHPGVDPSSVFVLPGGTTAASSFMSSLPPASGPAGGSFMDSLFGSPTVAASSAPIGASAAPSSIGGIPTMYLIGGAAVLFLMMGKR